MALPDIRAVLTASTEGFETAILRAVRASQTAAEKIGQHTEHISHSYERLKQVAEAAVAIFAAEKFIGLIEGSVAAADKLERLAQSTGIAVEKLGGLGFAAHLADVDLDSAAAGFVKLDKSIAGAAAGNKEATAVYSALGISVKDASGNVKSADQVLAEAADKFASYEDGANKTALAIALFGKRGAELIPFLNQGGTAIQENIEYYKRYSGVTEELTKKAAEFEDTQKRISLLTGAFGNYLTAGLLPGMQAIANEFLTMKENGDQFKEIAGDIVEVIKEIAIAATFAVQGILFFRNATKELGEIASAAVAGTLTKDYSSILDENEVKFARQIDTLKKLREGINAASKEGGDIDFGKSGDGQFGKKKQAPGIPTVKEAKDAVDPLVEYLNNLNKEGLKLNFDVANFDRFKGAAESSKSALVEFDIAFGKFSDATRAEKGLPALTAAQKQYAAELAATVVKAGEALKVVKALYEFDQGIKQLQLETSLIGQSNEQRTIAIKLFELEKQGVKAGTDEYQKRVAVLTEAINAQAQAQQNQQVKAFQFSGDQSHQEAQFQISLIGKTKDQIQDLTAARQIDLAVQQKAYDETGKLQVSQQTLNALQAEAEYQKAKLFSDNEATRSAQRSALTGTKDFFNDYVATANDAASQIKGVLTDAFQGAEDAFVKFTQTGKLDFKSLADSLVADLARISFKQSVAQGLQSLSGVVDKDSFIGQALSGIAGKTGKDGGLGTASAAAAPAINTMAAAAEKAALALSGIGTSGVAGAVSGTSTSSVIGSAISSIADKFTGLGQGIQRLFSTNKIATGVAPQSTYSDPDYVVSAKGNVFAGGNVIPFASGGVVNRPTIFPLKKGGVGLMGEAGPEAIVPMRPSDRPYRDRAGKLRIDDGAPTRSDTYVTNINNMIADAGSRGSQAQVTDQFVRALDSRRRRRSA